MKNTETIIQVAEEEERRISLENTCLVWENYVLDEALEVSVATVETAFVRSKMSGNESYFMLHSVPYG
jgi:hypothetical protein